MAARLEATPEALQSIHWYIHYCTFKSTGSKHAGLQPPQNSFSPIDTAMNELPLYMQKSHIHTCTLQSLSVRWFVVTECRKIMWTGFLGLDVFVIRDWMCLLFGIGCACYSGLDVLVIRDWMCLFLGIECACYSGLDVLVIRDWMCLLFGIGCACYSGLDVLVIRDWMCLFLGIECACYSGLDVLVIRDWMCLFLGTVVYALLCSETKIKELDWISTYL